MSSIQSALIIGASRGLGFAITKELIKRGVHVTATCRKGNSGELPSLVDQYPTQLSIENLDITDSRQIEELKSRLKGKSFDLLFVNAGTANAKGMQETIAETSTDEFVRVLLTNTLAPMRVIESLDELVKTDGIIGAMSSGQGSISDNVSGGNDVYRASKAALNMIMRSYAARSGQNHALLLLAPGWIKTDMGGSEARFTIEETIGDIVNTILSRKGQRGLRYLDRFGQDVKW